ncbi:hypothetical protein JOQ06_021968 [Pogonophryne albipinna]|uniref:Uncharacterized protein n=1 Tax=Pogonophryne albipinna TaxID=1090488 RepID=A0AAD6A7I1_9TELE|nr:hypothetical protein JOQ06_021968 [Pogonophryne albipinna]
MDGLYEEYGMVEAILSSSEMEGCHSEERYLKLFSKAEVPLVNLRKVSAYIFSIPCSNAHTEQTPYKQKLLEVARKGQKYRK